jgi:hypothetical protein
VLGEVVTQFLTGGEVVFDLWALCDSRENVGRERALGSDATPPDPH